MSEEKCNCQKKRIRKDEEKKSLCSRLNRIEGQVRGIKKMIESDTYCIDILTQVSAAQAALTSLSRMIMDSHIRNCVVKGVEEGDEKILDELMITLKKFMK